MDAKKIVRRLRAVKGEATKWRRYRNCDRSVYTWRGIANTYKWGIDRLIAELEKEGKK